MTFTQKPKKISPIFITFLTSFLLWVLFCYFFFESQKSVNITSSTESFLTNSAFNQIPLQKLEEVSKIVKENYYSYDGVQKKDIEDGVVKWYVNSLWDKHTEYMNGEEKKQFEEMLNGDFEWIWAVVDKHELWVSVDQVISGSPAKKSDIRSGDIITKVNGVSIAWDTVYQAVEKIKWPAGSQVILTLIRAWESGLLEKTVTRDKIKIPSVESKVFTWSNLWYITINIFWEDTSSEFDKALTGLMQKKVAWIVIDLRDNGWGYLQSAVDILSHFVENRKLLVQTRYRNPLKDKSYYSLNNGDIYTWKLVVLVNGNTASASEITSWALRDYGKAIIVGEKTYGKWSVQEPFDLSDGSLLKLTIAQWYTPKGHMIDKQGISPDVEVLFKKEDYEKAYDRQLEEAKKVLQTFIDKGALQLTIDSVKKTEWTQK